MGVCWTFIILLCSFSEVTQSHNTCICNGTLQVSNGSNREVHVPCPHVDAGITVFELYRDEVVESTIKCTEENKSLNCTPPDNVIMHQTRLSISFIVTERNYGIYKCQGSSEFPPPFKIVPGEVQIHVGEPQCKNSSTVTNPKQEFLWIWIVVLSVLVIYSITLTIIALVCWTKLKKVDSQNDYMNTKPRALRGLKKRGVQNPIPRYL